MASSHAPPSAVSAASALRDAEARLRQVGVDDARIEAEVLLCHALGVAREALYARLREPMAFVGASAFERLLQRRLSHEPAAYITGQREFYGLDFVCTADALIPRPETELLVELALHRVKDPGPAARESLIVDVGTGSGAIAVALAAHAPRARIVAADTSGAALALARRNAARHGVAGRIDFIEASLLDAVRGVFDVVVANLPYIPTDEYARLPPEIRDYEPEAALHAGPRGTELIEVLLVQAAGRLGPGGLLLAEHAWDQGERLRDAACAAFRNARIETAQDLAGYERVLIVETR